jgi:hypothetical protein
VWKGREHRYEWARKEESGYCKGRERKECAAGSDGERWYREAGAPQNRVTRTECRDAGPRATRTGHRMSAPAPDGSEKPQPTVRQARFPVKTARSSVHPEGGWGEPARSKVPGPTATNSSQIVLDRLWSSRVLPPLVKLWYWRPPPSPSLLLGRCYIWHQKSQPTPT